MKHGYIPIFYLSHILSLHPAIGLARRGKEQIKERTYQPGSVMARMINIVSRVCRTS
jgi:hypothetical protein